MRFPEKKELKWIANFINARIVGDENAYATGINEIHKVERGDLAFVDHPKYYDKCLMSAASFIIIDREVTERYGKTLLVCDQPFEAYLSIVRHFRPFQMQETMVSPLAVVGKNAVIMPGVFIGHHVVIGDNCVIHPNAVIYNNCIIGNEVTIHAGAVLGSDAFYYNTKKNREVWYKKMESCGRVIIEDHAEIGANCCIVRGVTHDTIIGKGTKLDSLVQIGHDVVVGNNCIIAAQVGIAGATTIGNGVSLWGQVGVSKTLKVGDNAIVLAQSGIPSDIEGNKTYWGTPVIEAGAKRRELVYLKRLPEMWEKLRGKS